MAKSSSVSPIFKILPLLAVIAAVGGGYYLYKYKPDQFNQIKTDVQGKVKGATTDLNIDTSALVNEAQKKLMDSQPIITDSNGGTSQSTIENTLKTETQKIINQAITQAQVQAQNIPKKEVARMTREVCNQIVNELEKE